MPVPPNVLSSLQVFEAVARLGNFSTAAEALNVTQGAVSHRIKQLELSLGLTLMRRTTRRLELTEDGEKLARAARFALAEISTALADLRQEKSGGPLALSVLSSVAAKWLVPKLGGYQRRSPDNPVSIQAQDTLANFRDDGIDAALRFSPGPKPGLHATYLAGDMLVPVASPRMFEGGTVPTSPETLARYPLHADMGGDGDPGGYNWETWFQAVGSDITPDIDGLRFNRADITIQAAINGQGIALGRAMLLEQDLLEHGLLIQVGRAVPTKASYYFVTPPEKANWPKVVTFRNWLKEEILATYKRMSEVLEQ